MNGQNAVLPFMGKGQDNSATWIDDGEKYAIVALNVKVDGQIPQTPVAPYLWALANTPFHVPSDWREWLGSIRAREVENCNLILLSKLRSLTPDILDDENKLLQKRVRNFYIGLLLASTFAPGHKPVMLTGTRRDGEIGVRQQQDLNCPIPCLFHPYPPIVADDVQLAGRTRGKS